MKVTIINHSDTAGGASVVSFRLMEALREAGVDARMLVARKSGHSPFVTQAAPGWRRAIPFVREHLRILGGNGFSRADMFKASLATDGLPLSRHPLVKDADAVILAWVNQGMLSLDEIGRIAAAKPVVWVMHDMWNFTGVCHHAERCAGYLTHCAKCPLLNSKAASDDLSAITFDRKKALYDSTNIRFVAVSRWLAGRARESALLGNQKVLHIPNAMPVEQFGHPAAFTRQQLGLPEETKLVLFCAARIDDPIKGLPTAIGAFNDLAETHLGRVTAVFVGAMKDPKALDDMRLPYVHLGPVTAPARMQAIMSHASAVLSTSTFETLPTVLIEGQAAGAVPVGPVHDGRAEIIEDGVTGYAARPELFYKDSELCPTALCRLAPSASCLVVATADALRLALDTPIPSEVLRAAAARYSAAAVARQFIELF